MTRLTPVLSRFIPRRPTLLALAMLLASCGSQANAPTTAVVTPTRIINVSGDMNYGNVALNSRKANTLTIQNQGNAPLTVTNITGPTSVLAVIAMNWTSGTIQPGASQNVSLTFVPTALTTYSGALLVIGDQTGGTGTIQFSGTGTLDGVPLFVRTGVGDASFDLPLYVTKIHVVANFSGFSANLTVAVNGRTVVSVGLGTESRQTFYDASVSTGGGGPVRLSGAGGVAWTISEER